jgi:hypothetical protein
VRAAFLASLGDPGPHPIANDVHFGYADLIRVSVCTHGTRLERPRNTMATEEKREETAIS